MLSYRHAFHAGNHADVLKHAVLMLVLEYMQQKDKPLLYVDTHAGAGMYDLRGAWAGKTREYETGIARIWQDSSLPEPLHNYINLVKDMNPEQALLRYPGSPCLVRSVLRPVDKARLFELHHNEFELLREEFSRNKQFKVEERDGFQSLCAVLPPESRRAVILIDPAYEVKADYQTVLQAVQAGYNRFATGVYLIWYPVVNRHYVDGLEHAFKTSGIRDIMLFELAVTADLANMGMTASGLIVINPPWKLEASMNIILPYLQSRLEQGEGSAWRIERLAAE